jgi:hypothetical protein
MAAALIHLTLSRQVAKFIVKDARCARSLKFNV